MQQDQFKCYATITIALYEQFYLILSFYDIVIKITHF